jgi:hypothetical protein
MSGNPESWLSDEDRAKVVAAIRALPPMTDEQIASICEVLIAARDRRLAEKRRATQRPSNSAQRASRRRAPRGANRTRPVRGRRRTSS